jgi:Fe-S-cluster containining protein
MRLRMIRWQRRWRYSSPHGATIGWALGYALSMRVPLPSGDQQLVQIIDAALADTAHRSGEWLVCKLGCTQCCIGAFAINQLDAVRLQQGLAELEVTDPARAAHIRDRARASISRLAREFPGNPETGILDEGEAADALFGEFANDEPCPVLDPLTGACDLYQARPMTCRVFGPPVQSEGGLGVCELCYHGASEEEIAACEMTVDPEDMEPALLEELERTSGRRGRTIVAFAVGL